MNKTLFFFVITKAVYKNGVLRPLKKLNLQQGEEVEIEIKDAVLRTKGIISQKEKGRAGVGILNVITRMRMFYGEKLSISLITEVDKGTEFIFQLPIPETESGM